MPGGEIELGRIIADQLQRGCELAERIQPADPAFLRQLPFGISDGRGEDDEADIAQHPQGD
jgi:hypothetical protein